MDHIKQYSLNDLVAIIHPIAQVYKVTGVSLFGSRARGDFSDKSDYDLLIDVEDDFSYGDYGAFIDDVSQALGSPVDVVTRRSLTNCDYDRTILEEEIRIF